MKIFRKEHNFPISSRVLIKFGLVLPNFKKMWQTINYSQNQTATCKKQQ